MVFVWLVVASWGCLAAEAPTLDRAWALAENNLATDACRMFRELKGHPGIDERERAFGEASTLLNLQPRTSDNVRRAGELFESLSADKDLKGLLSRFFLARILSDYVSPPRYSEALSAYRELLALRTGNPVVENSASRIVAIEEAGHPDRMERLEALRALEPLTELLSSRAGRRDFYFTLGFAYLNAGDAAAGLRALLAADAEGITRPQAERNAWIAIAEAARATGDTSTAKTYYRRFLEKYRRDNRAYTVARHLEALGNEEGNP